MQRETPDVEDPFWRRLLHRWLVQYNPMYLLSAALVLGGVIVLSREMTLVNSSVGQVGVAAIAEVYAWALIGGAALLTRIKLRRPAVMLALLTALYQGDLTLHTETCAYLGSIGIVASGVWFASFIAKLHALAWALKLRLTPTARIVPALGAAGLAVIPHLFHHVAPESLSAITALWIFALGAAGLWTRRSVSSKVLLDPWAASVLHRATNVTWALWAVLAVAHALFWFSERQLSALPLLAIAPLLATRWLRRERNVWCSVAATMAFVGLIVPTFFSIAALMASCVLVLRALRQPTRACPPIETPSAEPYRIRASPEIPRSRFVTTFGAAPRDALQRLFAGATLGLYLSCWTAGWSGGPWPEHILWLDALMTLVFIALMWKWRLRVALVPIVVIYAHWSIHAGLVGAPHTPMEWGATAVGTGFVMLLGSLMTSWHLQRRAGSNRPASSANAFPDR